MTGRVFARLMLVATFLLLLAGYCYIDYRAAQLDGRLAEVEARLTLPESLEVKSITPVLPGHGGGFVVRIGRKHKDTL